MLLAFVINMVVIAAHFEALKLISTVISHMSRGQRTRIIVGVLGAIAAHTAEI